MFGASCPDELLSLVISEGKSLYPRGRKESVWIPECFVRAARYVLPETLLCSLEFLTKKKSIENSDQILIILYFFI